MELDRKTKIIALCGSLRKKSFTRMALNVALQGAQEFDIETEFIDLKKYSIPFCDASDKSYNSPDVIKISELLKSAQGLIIGSPEYHGSYSGVLKNLLDLLGFKEFEGKIIGLVGIAGGALGATGTLNGLRNIFRQLHGWVLPSQVSIPRASKAFDENENLIDIKLEGRLKDVGRDVAKFAYLHHSSKSLETLNTWQKV
ncbi:MAG: NAD(P)H-dependent oxidoreductase [Candidatus Heimdallarchaeota archaeon]|nr:NAD(P)H-dependent oxidoreductase [Candidatus Heimdallarchaeota archaeon]